MKVVKIITLGNEEMSDDKKHQFSSAMGLQQDCSRLHW
jgi:hypothetical protein